MKNVTYRLREGVNLVHEGEDFYLLSEIPLVAVKVNKALYEILSEMRRSTSFPCSLENDNPLVDLLDRLVIKGLLVRDETFEHETYPPISIIIPVKNRPRDIRDCLSSLEALDYPRDKVEVIAVDDGSTDSTTQVMQAFQIKAISLRQSIGASACRNLAAREAKGDLIGFIDSDCVPRPGWLRELVPYFEEETIGIVGGYVSNFYNRTLLDRYEDVKSSLHMGSHAIKTDDARPSNFYVPSCNLITRKKAFLEARGFQEDLHVGEDVDLCWRVRKLGYQLLYVPRGEVKHKHRNDLIPMLKRRFDYGTSEAILSLRHRDKRKMLYLPPLYAAFFISVCLGIILGYPLLFIPALGILGVDFVRNKIRMSKTGLKLRNSTLFLSVMRSCVSFSYLASSYLARYYLIFFALIACFYPRMWLFLLFLLFFSGVVDFLIRRPKIDPFSFLLFYTMDQLSYQIGVLWGCIMKKNFVPYVPVIVRNPG